MDLILNLFTKKELIIIASIIIGLLFLTILFTLLDLFSKNKSDDSEEFFQDEKNNDDLLVKMENKIEEPKTIEVKKEESIKVETNEIKEEKVEELKINEVKEVVLENKTTVEPLIIDMDEELVLPTISKEEKAKLELLKIEEELKESKSFEDTITSLEAVEEENAIISYQELLENTKELKIVDEDTGDEPISLKEILTLCQENTNDSLDNANVSALDGSLNETNLAKIQLENTANLEKLEKEIRKTNEFLNILNELKKNLD